MATFRQIRLHWITVKIVLTAVARNSSSKSRKKQNGFDRKTDLSHVSNPGKSIDSKRCTAAATARRETETRQKAVVVVVENRCSDSIKTSNQMQMKNWKWKVPKWDRFYEAFLAACKILQIEFDATPDAWQPVFRFSIKPPTYRQVLVVHSTRYSGKLTFH